MQVSPGFSRSWVITITSMKFQKGVLVVNNVNPDNQVDTLTATGAPAYMKLQYGTAEAYEEVLFDYPWGGLTFQVSAAMVRLYAPQPFVATTRPPRLGAFISGKNTVGLTQPSRLTFTVLPVAIGALATVTFYPPNRAVGYRLFTTGTVGGTLGTFQLIQVSIAAAGLCFDANNFSPDGIQGPPAEEGFFRLIPQAQALQVVSQDAANSHNVGVIWMLDVG
jgi:hypothetical protein